MFFTMMKLKTIIQFGLFGYLKTHVVLQYLHQTNPIGFVQTYFVRLWA
jgi:hypothetical protein